MVIATGTRREAVVPARAGFAPIELVVLLAAIMALVAVALPMLLDAGAKARAEKSRNNLNQMIKATKNYEGLGRGNVPPKTWEDALKPFIEAGDEVFICPLRDEEPRNGGVYSYAMYTGAARFGRGDMKKIAIVTSDDRLIDIETEKCKDGTPVVTGKPVARYRDQAFALHYGGGVRNYKLDEIMPDDNENIVRHWMPDREHGLICGTVIVIDRDGDDE